jgi:prophage antirepressor-like protein
MSNIEIYIDSELELKVSINEDTIWLTQKQIAEVFDVNVPAISKHIKNIYKDNELEEFGTISVLEIVQNEGNREVLRSLEHYNLDIILAVGYRTNSSKAIKFRRWASKVLKSYINDGYVINTHKITEQRLSSLENDMSFIKSQIKNNTLEIKQGIFFNGQIFDAYIFVNDLIKSAKDEIILFDNYIDETVLTLLSKNPNINITLYTQNISKQLNLDIQKYNSQFINLTVNQLKNFHDRFLIIDDAVYHIGASMKDLGNKVFAFSKLELSKSFILNGVNP